MADKNLYVNDLIHRYASHTFTETTVQSETKVEFKNAGSVVIATSQKLAVIDAYRNIRYGLLEAENPVFNSTTTQRDALTSIDNGTHIYNITVGRDEVYNGTKWQNVSRRSIVTGITASSSKTQGAALLTADLNIVNTVAGNDYNVTLPFAAPGIPCVVFNRGTKKMDIFPNTDDDLGQGVNQAVSLAAGSAISFHCSGIVNWEAL